MGLDESGGFCLSQEASNKILSVPSQTRSGADSLHNVEVYLFEFN
jgi:hypothetical protein